jgi:hypothetical protein
MTTITFKQDIEIKKFEFEDVLDFKNYLENHFYLTSLNKLDDKMITSDIRKKITETKKLKSTDFVNIQ